MKRLMGTIKGKAEDRRKSEEVMPQGDSPEAIVAREVTAFCESGGPNNTNAGNEYLHLPAIVDAAESSPAAATEAARRIRRFVSKDNHQRAYAQYNAIMLTRILTDNPAERFSKNFDAKFVSTIKELLREGRDMSVQQILRETLDYFETEKVAGNQSLLPLVEMWKKEKSKAGPRPYNNPQRGSRILNGPAFSQQQQQQQQHGQQQQTYFNRPSAHARGLPPPDELAARIEEAKTTARLLLQTIQSTPNSELLGNDLIKEFADRASSANRSIQGYINAENPAPDEDTMLTLIETNEQLSIAMSKHQRALLQARKAISATPLPQPQAQPGQTAYAQQDPQPQSGQNMYHVQPLQAGPGRNLYPTPLSLPPRAHEEAYIPAPGPPRRGEEETYAPPAGPPPGAIGAVRNKEYPVRAENNAYTLPPPIPARSRPMSEEAATPTRTLDYGVAENPFDDTVPEPQQPQQKSYSLFDRPSRTTPPPQSNVQYEEDTQANPLQEASPQKAYEPYNPGYRSTPSYVYRQESATNNLTMHGANPPPDEGQTNGMRRRPISPVDQVHDAQRRLGNMRV